MNTTMNDSGQCTTERYASKQSQSEDRCMFSLLFASQVYNGSYDAPYVNPKAPVHFITGAAVSITLCDAFSSDGFQWEMLLYNNYVCHTSTAIAFYLNFGIYIGVLVCI